MFPNIDKQQFPALVKILLLVQLRGRSGKTKYSRLLSIGITYAIASAYLGWSLTRGYYEPAFLLISFSVMLYIAGFTFISSYPLILLNEQDKTTFQSLPVNESTMSAARGMNLIIYILYVSVPFILPLMGFYYYASGDVFSSLFYAVCMLLSAVWATLLFLFMTLALLQRSSKYYTLLSALQMILVFGLLIFYQAMPRYFLNEIAWEAFFTHPITYILPPFWFTSLFLAGTGATIINYTGLLSIIGIATLLVLLYLVIRVWNTPIEISQQIKHKPISPFLKWYDRFFTFTLSPSTKAGYDIFTQLSFRERTYRLQILPMALMPIAAAIYGVLSGELHTPFPQLFTGWYSKMHIPVMVFYLFVVRHSEHTILQTPMKNAQWLIHTIRQTELHEFRNGIRQALAARLNLPIGVLLIVLFTFSMPLLDSFLQGAFVILAGYMQSVFMNLFSRTVPFTEEANQLEAFKRVSQLFIVLPFLVVFWMLHYFFSTTHLTFATMLLIVALVSIPLNKLSSKKKLFVPAMQ